MKNNGKSKIKILFTIIFIIFFAILIFSSFYLYNKWYSISRDYTYMTKEETDLIEQDNIFAFIYDSFPILLEPFDYNQAYENLVNKNEISKQGFKEYIDKKVLNKINIRKCTIDYQLISQSNLEDCVEYNYIAYFYDKDYYKNNTKKEVENSIAKININVISYYPGSYKLEIPIN